MGARGAIRIDANFAMISGDPYALAQSMFGLEITGLLQAGEVYHKYWIDKGSDEIACFRAPMTCQNNIRRMKLSKSEDAAYWYQYIDTALIYNAFDSACEAENGADKDGDTNMCTNNPIIVNRTLNSPTIICIQKKAEKIVPTEDDIIKANKLAFNDDIGVVTNHVTSMIEVQSGFKKGTIEYETLAYRIMCGQLYQQNTIDRAKGIIAKPMPSEWFTLHDCKIKDDDDEKTKTRKEFNFKISAAKKPYFMTYVYPKLKSENDSYVRNNSKGAIRRFNEYGIKNIDDLKAYEGKTLQMIEYCKFYERLMPVGNNPCVVNRISWIFEKTFQNYVSKISKLLRDSNKGAFDYSILKSGVVYAKNSYIQVYEIYQDYLKKVEIYQKKNRIDKNDRFDNWLHHQAFVNYFRDECYKVCSNEDELCDIVLDICYQTEKSKQFAWYVCGRVILQNLLKNNNNTIQYPYCTEAKGEFTYFGKQFNMVDKEIEVIDDDYS